MAVGMAMVIIAGEFDLSVGSVMALSGVIAALAMQHFGEVWVIGAMTAVAAGAAVGLINGALTTTLGVPLFLHHAGFAEHRSWSGASGHRH